MTTTVAERASETSPPDGGPAPGVRERLRAERLATAILRSPFGALLCRPWFDRFATWLLRRWYFPLSRLWAAARIAERDPGRFAAAVPMAIVPARHARLNMALSRFEAARDAVGEVEENWQRAFFGGDDPGTASLVAAESARLDRRARYNATRRHFRFLARSGAVPLVRFDIPSPEEAAAIYEPLLADAEAAFAPPGEMPAVEASRKVPTPTGVQYWLRFASPSARAGDTVFARVQEPADAENPPTLVFGHGICVEFDHWRGLVDEVGVLNAMGLRVIRPEAPWHGRRVPAGEFGGERLIATSPLGMLDLFEATAREWPVLIDWARRAGAGPVAIGGSSLGALTAQSVADKARGWPARLRPDAMLLITHCDTNDQAALGGKLAEMWGIHAAAEARGWSPRHLAPYRALMAAGAEPVMPATRIVSVTGKRDIVTPFASGLAQLNAWGVPAENRFIWDRGHFSVPLTLIRDRRPLARFGEVLERAGGG